MFVCLFVCFFSHMEHCRELQQGRDRCLTEHMLTQAQVETLGKALKEQDLLLADKVIRRGVANGRDQIVFF